MDFMIQSSRFEFWVTFMNDKRSEYRFWLLFGQLGFTVVSPMVAFWFLSVLLDRYFATPDWLMVVLILLGLATGLSDAVKQLWAIAKREDMREKKKKGEHSDEK